MGDRGGIDKLVLGSALYQIRQRSCKLRMTDWHFLLREHYSTFLAANAYGGYICCCDCLERIFLWIISITMVLLCKLDTHQLDIVVLDLKILLCACRSQRCLSLKLLLASSASSVLRVFPPDIVTCFARKFEPKEVLDRLFFAIGI